MEGGYALTYAKKSSHGQPTRDGPQLCGWAGKRSSQLTIKNKHVASEVLTAVFMNIISSRI
jgi:hypothetical protein